ncbi:4-alpha-glucanotransferase [Bordetella hinzii]|uniref:4-alpha-glucanotransferase n=1 Tax=Bordetella hinzii TaxID=103855 RepID=UPI00045AFA43|nr:4-alpha-glucanotransferase [Bordetella hinzii]KCB45015.1 4-alpha-glucanotransferase [Bordetella hinzii 4161]KXA71118.1 hypothetical protein AXA74_20235 [Bordetella hinzii LMG 13501]QDJ38790.1 4-alpha-glucanotransferase [Bordetella hinzii]QDJ47877.1 4-alpha-glucanotransferase [Bordetella hinzii]QDJ56764.1 4-alpha-glucanotransferase [Bordetella hinzii]
MTPTSRAIRALAAQAGLQEHWTDARQQPRQVAIDTLRRLLDAMGLACASEADIQASRARLRAPGHKGLVIGRAGEPLALPARAAGDCWLVPEDDATAARRVRPERAAGGSALRAPQTPGYYQLRLPGGTCLRLAIAPGAATAPAAPRQWGAMAQVYSLRMRHADPARATRGHGDFAAVRQLAQRLAAEGADALMLSPVHAMFSADPAACSPYCPSSRLFWNAAFAAPADMLGEDALRAAMAALPSTDWAALDDAELIDWPGASAVRMRLMRRLHEQFRLREDDARARFQTFVRAEGQALADHAVFESLHASHAALSGTVRPWPAWDTPWRDPRSARVRDYAAAHGRDVEFHCFLQWLAAGSLQAAQRGARQAGMRVGLISDLAVGASHFGSQAWSRPDQFLGGVSIGAPPDIHQPAGQVWRLTAFSPQALRQQDYQPFIDVLRASLRHGGGLRIDHILGFERLWVVPEGAEAADGAYLHMPGPELMALASLEAWRHGARLIGEDLGTVPPGFDTRLREAGISGMNVLWFMRDEAGGFLPASRWPAACAALTTTHDLPTLAGWWEGHDLAQRDSAGLLGGGAPALRQARARDREALARRLELPPPLPAEAPLPDLLAFVASAPCALMLASLEDLAGERLAPNVPGTVDTFPNWRRRLPGDTVAACDTPCWRQRLEAIRRGRRQA